MNSYMTKLEFLPEPYMIFRIGKLSLIHVICFALSLSSFIDPYERFVMLLKSRSRTHHPHMHYSYTGCRRKNMSIHLDPPKNVLLLHQEKPPKNALQDIHKINAPSSCCYLSKVLLQKRGMGYAKVIHKKRRIEKKWTIVRDI